MKFILKFKRFLWLYSGEDPQIIGSDTIGVLEKKLFAFVGLFVLSIFFTSALSIYFFVSNLFYNIFLDIMISAVVAMIFTNLYLLTLYTITPPLLPAQRVLRIVKGKYKVVNVDSSLIEVPIGASLILRLCILILLALFIAQPYNVIIFSSNPEHNQFAGEIRDVISKYPQTWMVNIIFCTLFLLPVYWKYLIRRYNNFYTKKQVIERKFVEDNYFEFLAKYSQILTANVNFYNVQSLKRIYPLLTKLEVLNKKKFLLHKNQIIQELNDDAFHKYENYTNPPFNTQKKSTVTNYYSEKDFLNLIYNQE